MLPPQLQNFKLDPPQWDISVELAIGESIQSILLVLSYCHGLLVTLFLMEKRIHHFYQDTYIIYTSCWTSLILTHLWSFSKAQGSYLEFPNSPWFGKIPCAEDIAAKRGLGLRRESHATPSWIKGWFVVKSGPKWYLNNTLESWILSSLILVQLQRKMTSPNTSQYHKTFGEKTGTHGKMHQPCSKANLEHF